MSAVDRFIAGEDRLSAVLKAIPFYDAPDSLATSVRAAAYQTERDAWKVVGAQTFKPSAALEEAVLREAKHTEAAQTTRREALWNTLAHASVAEALGAPVSAATETWLRQQQAERDAARAQTSARGAQNRWWTLPRLAFGISCGLALFIGLSVHHAGMTTFAPQTDEADAPLKMAATLPEAPSQNPPAPPLQIAAAPEAKATPASDEAVIATVTQEENEARARGASMASPAFAEPPKHANMRAAASAANPAAAPPSADSEMAAVPPPPPAVGLDLPPPSVATAKRGAARAMASAYTYPIHDAQWQQLAHAWILARQQEISRARAATADATAAAPTPVTWYLEADDPETEEIRALAARLRAALPPGVTLVLRAQPDIPRGYARLLR
ncbi:MAG: hypothetical protein LBQ81_07970 [Zoogloeaceae bacterium]|jgi:hypothetical protein|nr:hypothetical protein [Zoogloeaceae bacterium]